MKKCCSNIHFYIPRYNHPYSSIIITTCINCDYNHILKSSQDWFDVFNIDRKLLKYYSYKTNKDSILPLPIEVQLFLKIS